MNQLFASGGQSIGASSSVFPMNIQRMVLLCLLKDILNIKMLDSVVPAGCGNGHRESKMMAKQTLTLFACLLPKKGCIYYLKAKAT